MNHTILETVHGSHLYGMNHADSDLDIFRVVRYGTKTLHKITEEADVTTVPFDLFMRNVFSGSHQSCEALFSPLATVHSQYAPLFSGLRITGADVFAKYRRTIHSFSYGPMKQRRHAVRLGYNLADLRRTGRFNPVMTEDQKLKIGVISQLYWGQSLYDIAINF